MLINLAEQHVDLECKEAVSCQRLHRIVLKMLVAEVGTPEECIRRTQMCRLHCCFGFRP